MKTIVTTFFIAFSVLLGYAQEKTKKQIKEEQKAAKEKQIDALVESKEYEFIGDMAFPQGMRNINLTTNDNYFRVQKDTIDSSMPFFGRAYSGVGYGGDGGMDFKGEMKNYSIEKKKKNYIIKADVKKGTDTFSIILTVYFNGDANLSINSSNRSPISYRGSIDKFKQNK